MAEQIGIVTNGRDCPGLNAVNLAVAEAAAQRGWEAVGFLGGYEGLLDPPKYRPLNCQELDMLLTRGGTILGTANRGPFSMKVGHGETRGLPKELIDGVKADHGEDEHLWIGEHRRRRLAEHRSTGSEYADHATPTPSLTTWKRGLR